MVADNRQTGIVGNVCSQPTLPTPNRVAPTHTREPPRNTEPEARNPKPETLPPSLSRCPSKECRRARPGWGWWGLMTIV
ncbi:hypothetical protein T484DRAFT_2723884 [Baffinella frigidus]|nr:hypothetical protein T484DRAFT_2723884 [Cryptophyta sp. CCMP2293]